MCLSLLLTTGQILIARRELCFYRGSGFRTGPWPQEAVLSTAPGSVRAPDYRGDWSLEGLSFCFVGRCALSSIVAAGYFSGPSGPGHLKGQCED